MKKRIIAVLVCCLASVCLLAGCSGGITKSQDPQTLNRQYMTSINALMQDVKTDMDAFAKAVKEGETISLDTQLTNVSKTVERVKALEVPDAMKNAHTDYVKGMEELQTSLQLYVKLYQDIKAPAGGSFDYGTYSGRISEVKTHYDAGIAALESADKKVTEA